MASKATFLCSDSPNPPRPRGRDVRPFTLTLAGLAEMHEAEPQPIDQDDEYAFTCLDCRKPLPDCSCWRDRHPRKDY